MDTNEINLSGVIDLHIHTAPDVRPRKMNDIELAGAAHQAGMQAVLLKSHHTLTADRARMAEHVVSGIRVFGGLALNDAVGGLNPRAVEAALAMGAKEIWMPTLSAANHFRYSGIEGKGICILDQEGLPRSEVYDILDLIAAKNVILGTGHLSVEEIVILVRVARELGINRILVTHPELPIVNMPIGVQQIISGPGLFFERCLISTVSHGAVVSMAHIADSIRKLGSETTVLATDFGQINNPSPVEGMRSFIKGMIEQGFSRADIDRMTRVNPMRLLDLN